ncbi:Uncharacterised protein [Mycobacteroides abscessus subsp. massiliense]|uniref:hypothetical protein n=1 Tax=Mycobacteroides abscessus TaxID=36809 RepID=UPI0009CB88FC|nr:hypothetical protein [Mycobacteroides abscessus]SKU70739.1 Uncharacterised protein [Mycobacteroides abscessus subsp. massiliense]SKU76146.1 Uncharacterised protein [Mycobacteroides abscessus subsp. massiliense]
MTNPMPTRTGGKWYGRFRITPAGVPSRAAVGTPTITTGALTIRPTGVPSRAAAGTPTITWPQDIRPTSVPSRAALGTPSLVQNIIPAGVPSRAAVGTPTVTVGPVTIRPSGVTSRVGVGTPSVGQVVKPTGVQSRVAVGTPSLAQVIKPAAVTSRAAVGIPTLIPGPVAIAPTSVASRVAVGTPTLSQPASVNYNTQGVGTETTSSPTTCTISPNTGDDVLAFYSLGSGAVSSMTYGAGNLPMTCVGQALSNGVLIAAYLIRNVASGSATININKTGSSWGQAVAVSYAGSQGYRPAKSAVGNGTSFSMPVTVPLNGRTVHAFTPGQNSTTLSSLTGGTSRYLDNVGFLTQSVRDADAATTFGGSLSATRDWAALGVPLCAVAPTGPIPKYSTGTDAEGINGTKTLDVYAEVGDYVYCVVGQAGPGDPSAVTCAGTAMTLIDTVSWTHPNTSGGFLKIYRSAAAMVSAGAKTVSVTATGGNWWRAYGLAISGVSSPSGTLTKTAATASQPIQSVTCSADQLIVQIFITSAAPTGTTGGAALWLTPSGGQIFMVVNIADESSTFTIANPSVNWGAAALVLS